MGTVNYYEGVNAGQITNEGGSLSFNAKKEFQFIHLLCLYVEEEETNKGYGADLLATAKELAKKEKKPLTLSVGPYGHRKKNKAELIKWYFKNGFAPDLSDVSHSTYVRLISNWRV